MTEKRRKKYFHERAPRVRDRFTRHIARNIRRAAPALGGLFDSHDYLHGKNGWIDAWFIGANGTVYNCTFETTRCKYSELLWDKAHDAADELRPCNHGFDSVPVPGNSGLTEMRFRDDGEGPAFGGLKRYEWIDREARRLADTGTVTVVAEIELDREYGWGVGLHATIDTPYLTVESINAFIRDFIAGGEKAFLSDKALSYTSAELETIGPTANAIVDPLENPPNETETE